MPKAIQGWAGERRCAAAAWPQAAGAAPWASNHSCSMGPAPPGERWGWPESCRQSEVINPAGNPPQAAISETLRGRKGTTSPDSVFACFEWLIWQRNNSERIISPSCTKEKHPKAGVTPLLPSPVIPLPLQLSPNSPGDPLPPLLPPMGSPGGFLHPKPRLWGELTGQEEEGYGQGHEHAFS